MKTGFGAIIFGAILLFACIACGKPAEQGVNAQSQPAEVKLVKINVKGMTCAGCTGRVEALIKKLPGVKGCKASVEDKNVQVRYDTSRVELAKLEKTIEGAGYKVLK